MARTTFHSQLLDKDTGEIIEYRRNFITKNKERFIMVRITDGISWISLFNGNEMKLMLYMASYIDHETHYVFMSDYRRSQLVQMLGYKNDRSLNTLISGTLRKGGFKRVRKYNDTYMMNPAFTYAANTNEYDKIEKLYKDA